MNPQIVYGEDVVTGSRTPTLRPTRRGCCTSGCGEIDNLVGVLCAQAGARRDR